MSRDEVLSIMPTESVRTFKNRAGYLGGCPWSRRGMRISNPHRTVFFEIANGHVDIIYYYTNLLHLDGAVSDDELTPLFLENDILVGWGWDFVGENAEGYRLDTDPVGLGEEE
jgi:hypothetical protein